MKVALRNLIEIKSGYSPSTFELMEAGTVPYVKVEDMNNCTKYQHKSREYCEDVDRSVPAGSIIFPKRGAAIMNNKVRITAIDICMDTNMMAIIPNEKIQSEFLYYTIIHEKLSRIADTSTIPQINNKHINPYKVALPPLPEQKAIADLLSTWDEAIEKTERLVQAKEKRFKCYIQKLITLRCGSWPHIKPKEIFDTVTEKNFPDEELLSVTQNRGVIPRSMLEGRVMSPDGTTASYKLIKRGDFAISLRSFQGGIEYSNYQGIISPAYTVLRPKIELNNDFYRLFFKSYIFIEKYLNLAVIGIRDGKQISIPDFLSIKIPVPPLEEQKEIAEALTICQQEIDLLKQLAEKYKTQKRGLMQKILSGEWRVESEIVNQYTEA